MRVWVRMQQLRAPQYNAVIASAEVSLSPLAHAPDNSNQSKNPSL